MRARKTVISAIACAVVLLPASSALAGTGPAPAPGPAKQRAAKTTAPSSAGNPRSARAVAAGVCADAYQIGTTAYVDRAGAHVASVKQFYSPKCAQNYGYVWVWDTFRAKVKDYDVSAGVYSYSSDTVLGLRTWKATNLQEFWSDPASTVNQCTAAIGTLRAPGDPLPGQAATSKRC